MEKELQFHVALSTKDLWQFSMYHSNSGMLGLFNVIFTVAALFLLITRWGSLTVPYRLLLVVCVLLFTVWQPALLYFKVRRQSKKSTSMQPMDLIFSDKGLKVCQGKNSAKFPWEKMARVDRKMSMVILYMDRVHAYLLPKSAMGEQEEAFYEMARTYLPKERRRRI